MKEDVIGILSYFVFIFFFFFIVIIFNDKPKEIKPHHHLQLLKTLPRQRLNKREEGPLLFSLSVN